MTARATSPARLEDIARRLGGLPRDKQDEFVAWLAARDISVLSLPIVPQARAEAMPLSFAQRRLWLLGQLHPDSAQYNISRVYALAGALDVAALGRALHDLVARHESLRTTFHDAGGEPVQRIHPAPPADLTIDTARDVAAARAIADAEAARPFDLSRGPVFRARLVRITGALHWLVVTSHHIAMDEWSDAIVVRELAALYDAHRRGQAPELAPPAIQYADYAAWQRRWLTDDQLAAQLAYWRAELGTGAHEPVLATHAGDHDDRAESHVVRFDPALAARLRAFAAGAQTTLFTTLLAVLQVVLHRWSGQRDIRIGSPIANRNRHELEGVVGCFANTQVLRGQISPGMSFAQHLEAVKRTVAAAQSNQDLPFDRLVEALAPERVLGETPLFQVMLSWHRGADHGAAAGGLTITQEPAADRAAKFDLVLHMLDDGDSLTGELLYRAGRLSGATIASLAERYVRLAAAAIDAPDRPIATLPWLSSDEQARIAAWSTGSAEPADPAADLHACIARWAAATPDAPAVQFEAAQLSYRALCGRAARIAGELAARGVRPEDRVALCLPRSLDFVAGLVGILAAGAAYVPLDPRTPPERLRELVADAGIAHAIASGEAAALLGALGVRVLDDTELAGAPAAASPRIAPDAAAYVIYTSGSTGRPKGVVVSHRAITSYVRGLVRELALPTGAAMALVSTPTADLGNTVLFGALATGGVLHVVAEDRCFDPDRMAAYLRAHPVDVLKITPSHLGGLLHAASPGDVLPRHTLILGGETASAELLAQVRRYGRCRIVNHYGPTETTVGVLTYTARGDEAALPLGRPLPGRRSYVLGPDFAPLPPGVHGELYIGGAGVARGYLGRPDATADRFVPDPFADPAGPAGGRLYRTGDRARYRDDGTIEFAGRSDDQIKLRGHRIEPGEIRAALLRVPGVADAHVMLRDTATGPRLVAYAVPAAAGRDTAGPDTTGPDTAGRATAGLDTAGRDTTGPDTTGPDTAGPDTAGRATAGLDTAGRGTAGPDTAGRATAGPDSAAVLAQLAAWLPEHMVPGDLVWLARFPVTANGKIDRKALPEPGRQATTARAPRTPLETLIASVWQDVLARDAIGVDDGFFALGGDSLLAFQVVARLRKAGVALTIPELFANQTIAALARVARVTTGQPAAAAEPALLEGAVPLTPIQRWWAARGLDRPHHDNQSVLLALRAPIAGDALAAALARLVAHHDGLRLRFHPDGASWRQVYAADAPAALEIVDDAELAPAIARAQRSLDITRGPVLRAVLSPHRLLLVAHHLVVDGMSWRILLEDLARLLAGGDPLPATAPYQAWATALTAYARSAALAAEADHWRALAGDAALPGGGDPRANTVASIRTARAALDAAETRALLSGAPAAYRTQVDDLLLTALARTLCEWTGQASALIRLEHHGRDPLPDPALAGVDVSRTVGWFTTAYPVRLTPARELAASIKQIKEQLRGVPHHGVGHGVLRYLAEDPALAGALPPLTFNYLGQFDAVFDAAAPFSPAPESSGDDRDPGALRDRWFDVIALVEGGRLQIEWQYSPALHAPAVVDELAARYLHHLRAVIAHCTQPAHRGATPSDFPLAGLDQAELDALLAAAPLDRIEDILPLTPVQDGIAFHCLAAPDDGLYITQRTIELGDGLDVTALAAAWQEVAAAHDALRTSFVVLGLRRPVQIVWRAVTVPVERLSCDSGRALTDVLAADRARGFDLARPPLMRVTLHETAPGRTQLIWTDHHLLLDGWSAWRVLSEVLARYQAIVRGAPLPIERSAPARDHLAWLAALDHAAADRLWRDQLGDVAAPTLLAPHLPRAAGFVHAELALPAEATAQLVGFARSHGLTINTLVQGAIAIVIAAYAGADDVVFGVTVSGRSAALPGSDERIGLYINTLPLRVRLPAAMSVASWLRALQDQNAALREHEHTPLVRAQRASATRDRLFDTLLVFENYPIARGLGAAAEHIGIGATSAHERTNYPLTFEATPGEQLHLALDAQAIAPAAAHGLLARVARTLAQLAAARRLVDIALIGDDERAQLAAWNATAVALSTGEPPAAGSAIAASPLAAAGSAIAASPFTGAQPTQLAAATAPAVAPSTGEPPAHIIATTAAAPTTIPSALALFEAHADRRPEAIAVIDRTAGRAVTATRRHATATAASAAGASGDATASAAGASGDAAASAAGASGDAAARHAGELRYAELEARANRLAWRLIDAGVGPESLVAICAPRSRELVIALIAIWKAGAAYLPIDPDYPAARIAHMLDDARPAVVLAGGHPDTWRDAWPGAWPLDELAWSADEPGDRRGRPPARSRPDHLAYCIYTSGSTGTPKGVAVSHDSLVNFLAAMERRLGFDARGSFLALTSLSFDIAALELWLPLTRGARVVLAEREEAASADRLIRRLAGGEVSVVQATPTTWRTLSPAVTALPASCTLLCGGEAMPADLAARLVATGARVINVYGPTETTVWSTLHVLDPAPDPANPEPAIGRPIDNTAIYVLDSALRPVPPGATGELYIGGLGLARGYLRRPALTAERFLPDPFSPAPGARMYRTGDLARYRPDGILDCLGRSDAQVKLRGHRIELGEIEAALRAQPGVAHAAVAARGASEPRLVAYVVCDPAVPHETRQLASPARLASPTSHLAMMEAALRAALAAALPAVMLPQHYVFLDELPRTANGKLDRKALPDPAAHARPPQIAPRTAAERVLAAIWSRLLGQPELGVDDDFFALGGDSLIALQLVGAARAAGFTISPRDVFEYPTIADLAPRLVPHAGGTGAASDSAGLHATGAPAAPHTTGATSAATVPGAHVATSAATATGAHVATSAATATGAHVATSAATATGAAAALGIAAASGVTAPPSAATATATAPIPTGAAHTADTPAGDAAPASAAQFAHVELDAGELDDLLKDLA